MSEDIMADFNWTKNMPYLNLSFFGQKNGMVVFFHRQIFGLWDVVGCATFFVFLGGVCPQAFKKTQL